MKKLDIVALFVGVASLFLCLVFFGIFCFVGVRTFSNEGGVEKISEFFKSAKKEIVDVTGDNFVDVNSGDDHVSIGPDGIFVTDGDDKVIVSPTGIYIGDGKDVVSIDENGVQIDNSTEITVSEPDVKVNVDPVKVEVNVNPIEEEIKIIG